MDPRATTPIKIAYALVAPYGELGIKVKCESNEEYARLKQNLYSECQECSNEDDNDGLRDTTISFYDSRDKEVKYMKRQITVEEWVHA